MAKIQVLKMSKSSVSIFVFGIYLVVLGLILISVPNFILNLLGMPSTEEVWIRVVAVLVLILGFFHIQAGRTNLAPFFRWSVIARSSLIAFFTVFALLNLAKPAIILFGVIDLAGAIWTILAIRSEY
jgi:hypothetical protein